MRNFFLLITLLVFAGSPSYATQPTAYTPLGPGDIYLALGDSLAKGAEAAANNDNLPGYPDYFAALLKVTHTISYTNLGVSGETSSSMINDGQLDAAETYIKAQIAAGKVVSPVTLDIGGNDMVAVILPDSTIPLTQALTTFEANLTVILDRLLAALTVNGQRQGDLLMMNYYNPYPELDQSTYGSFIKANPDTDLPKFNAIIERLAAERNIPVFDAYTAFKDREPELIFVRYPYIFTTVPAEVERYLDYHPREAGHKVLARGFAETSDYILPRLYVPLTITR
jgi:lysophospholipase L1-like esterase